MTKSAPGSTNIRATKLLATHGYITSGSNYICESVIPLEKAIEALMTSTLEAYKQELLEKLPKPSKIGRQYSTSIVDRIAYDQAFNCCLDILIAIIRGEAALNSKKEE